MKKSLHNVNDPDDDAGHGQCATRLRVPASTHLELRDGRPLRAENAVCMLTSGSKVI
jgi:hypothetical protein